MFFEPMAFEVCFFLDACPLEIINTIFFLFNWGGFDRLNILFRSVGHDARRFQHFEAVPVLSHVASQAGFSWSRSILAY